MVAGLTNDFDGAWHAVFGAQLGGEGIVLLRSGFILGCDDQYFYEGRYVVDEDGGFRALVKVSHYAGDRAVSKEGALALQPAVGLCGSQCQNRSEIKLGQ